MTASRRASAINVDGVVLGVHRLAREALDAAGFPLLAAAEVADAAWLALESGATGHAWVVQPGRPPLDFRFPGVPGVRSAGGDAAAPPPFAP